MKQRFVWKEHAMPLRRCSAFHQLGLDRLEQCRIVPVVTGGANRPTDAPHSRRDEEFLKNSTSTPGAGIGCDAIPDKALCGNLLRIALCARGGP